MSKFIQYKKLQKYYLGSPVIPAEYKKGDLIMTGDFDSLESCQNDAAPTVYWVYPKGETELYNSNTGFTFTLGHSDTNYDYYLISGEGTSLSFAYTNVMKGSILNVINLTSMSTMFYGCTSLASLDVTGWDTSKVTNMGSMFNNCTSLAEIIGIQEWDVSKVTSMSGMFQRCSSLTSLNLTSWFRPSVATLKNLKYMFSGCTSLETLDLSNWRYSEQYQLTGIFQGCSSLTTLNLDNWGISSTTNTDYSIFDGCSSLQTIYLRGSDARTLNFINNQLQFSGIRDNVTIITE